MSEQQWDFLKQSTVRLGRALEVSRQDFLVVLGAGCLTYEQELDEIEAAIDALKRKVLAAELREP